MLRGLTDHRTYKRLAYQLVGLPLGIAYFVVLITGLSVGFGLLITLIGLPIILATLYVSRWMANLERALVGTLLDAPMAPVHRRAAASGLGASLKARLGDPQTWKDLVYLLCRFPIGVLEFTIVVTLVGYGLGLTLLPAYLWALPEPGPDLLVWQVDTLAKAFAVVPLGLLLLALCPPVINGLATLDRGFAGIMLRTDPDPESARRIEGLETSRSRILEATDAERRRIERNLHDGAQQRLVALALMLGMEKKRRPDDAVMDAAHEELQRALDELRDLARGIHPAAVTQGGLKTGLRDLAGRSPVPVELTALPDERLPAPVEIASYYVVAESLTNVAKHGQATHALVSARLERGALHVEVADDGAGGAELARGTGLRGLADRVGALDGTLEVISPKGEGTRVVAQIPCRPVAAA